MTNSVDLKLFKETSPAALAKKIIDEEDFFPVFLLKVTKNKVKDPELKNKVTEIFNIFEQTREDKDISETTRKTYRVAVYLIFFKGQAAQHKKLLTKAIFKYFKTNNEAMISLILEIGFKDPQEKRALVLEALKRREKNIVRFLFAEKRGVLKKTDLSKDQSDFPSKHHRYYSLLHFFAYDKNKEAVEKLLAEGEKIEDVALDKFTPFDSALARASALREDDFATARSMIEFCGASFETALAIKFYGHLLRKKGFHTLNKKCSISYEGLNYYYSAEQLGKWGGSFFATQKEKLLKKFSLNADDCKWFETVFKNAPKYCKNPQKLAQDIKDKKTVILCAGWDAHIVAVVIDENILMCNRGSGSAPYPGVGVYSKSLQNKIKLIEFCNTLQINAIKRKGISLFYSLLYQKQAIKEGLVNQCDLPLSSEEGGHCEATKLGLVHQYDLPLPRQEGGHCGWDSIEAAFIGTVDLYFRKHKKMTKESSEPLAKKVGKLWVEDYVIPGVKKELLKKHKVKLSGTQLDSMNSEGSQGDSDLDEREEGHTGAVVQAKKPTKANEHNIKAYELGLKDLTRRYMEIFPQKDKEEAEQQVMEENNEEEITSWGLIEVLGKEKPKTDKKQKLTKNEVTKEVKRIDKRYKKDEYKYGAKKGKKKKDSSSSSSSDSDSPVLKRKIRTKKGKEKKESSSSCSSDSDSPKLKRKNRKKK